MIDFTKLLRIVGNGCSNNIFPILSKYKQNMIIIYSMQPFFESIKSPICPQLNYFILLTCLARTTTFAALDRPRNLSFFGSVQFFTQKFPSNLLTLVFQTLILTNFCEFVVVNNVTRSILEGTKFAFRWSLHLSYGVIIFVSSFMIVIYYQKCNCTVII